jgi:hypothetical protein
MTTEDQQLLEQRNVNCSSDVFVNRTNELLCGAKI